MGDPKAIAAAAAAAATAARSSTGGGSRPGTGASGRVEVEGAPESDTDSSSYSAEDRGPDDGRGKTLQDPHQVRGSTTTKFTNFVVATTQPRPNVQRPKPTNQPTNRPTDQLSLTTHGGRTRGPSRRSTSSPKCAGRWWHHVKLARTLQVRLSLRLAFSLTTIYTLKIHDGTSIDQIRSRILNE